MNNNKLMQSIKNDINTILKTSDLISIKEVLESSFNLVSLNNTSEYFDFIELDLIQKIKEKEAIQRNFAKNNSEVNSLVLLPERNKEKRKFIINWIKEKKENLKESKQPEAITDLHHKYLQSFNSELFKNVTTKTKVDGSNNSLFINHNFLLGIYKERLTETISLKEHQDTLLVFNNRIGLLAGNIIKLYTKVNFYEDTKKPNYITQRDLLENDIKYSIKNIKDLYSDLIKEELRRKNFETAIDIQDFCISILNKTEYLLKYRFFISIDESPLNDSFKEINIELKNSIDLDKIKLLNSISKELQQPQQSNDIIENPYPFIFVNADTYNCFKDYTEKHILDFHLDYSYLKKRLEKEKLIHNQKDNDFAKFLFENKFISESKYGKYIIENKFYSLKKSTSNQRENNFNNVFEKLLANQYNPTSPNGKKPT